MRFPAQFTAWPDWALGTDRYGNSPGAYAIAAGVFIAALLGAVLAKKLAVGRLATLATRTTSKLDDLMVAMLADLRWWMIAAVLFHLAVQALILPAIAMKVIKAAALVAVAIQALVTSRLLIEYGISSLLRRKRGADGRVDPSISSATAIIRFLATLTVATIATLLLLANLGVEITPLITGLGIGGIAVALAAQSILADVFGSLSILFDKPFLVGDFIIVGDQMGTVENIGVKTTRVRALSGEQLVFANTDLLGSRIQNFKRMMERRAVFSFGIAYETPAEVVATVPRVIRDIASHQPKVRFDRAHFQSFGEYALKFEVVYIVLSPDYNEYADVQQEINLEILRRFERMGVRFAYPTQVNIQGPHRLDEAAVRRGVPTASATASQAPHGPTTPERQPDRP